MTQSNVLHAMQSGDQETALQTYDRALQLDRNNVDAYVARGAAFANLRDFSGAVADFETALGATKRAVQIRTAPGPCIDIMLQLGSSPERAQAENLCSLQLLIQSTRMPGGIWQQSERRWHS